jgi:NADH dehydrogenase
MDEAARRGLMTFVVAGGGFAGVETVGAINDFLRGTLRDYPELDPSMLRVVLIHSGNIVLPELGERLGRYAQEKLKCRGVEVRLGVRVSGYDDWIVKLSTGEAIAAKTLVWAAGASPAAAIESLPVEKVSGRLKVSQYLELVGHEGVVWAVGDCAAVPDWRGGLHPPTAQHGLRQGLAAAENIWAAVNGGAPKPFRFSSIGQLASIGHHTGVAQVLGMRFSGFVAWSLWRSVYLVKLPGIANKVRVAIQWILDLLFSRQIEQFLTLKALEQIELLAAQVRTSQAEANQPMKPTTENVGGTEHAAKHRVNTSSPPSRTPEETKNGSTPEPSCGNGSGDQLANNRRSNAEGRTCQIVNKEHQ